MDNQITVDGNQEILVSMVDLGDIRNKVLEFPARYSNQVQSITRHIDAIISKAIQEGQLKTGVLETPTQGD